MEKGKSIKRLISLAMSLALIFCIVPPEAFAAESYLIWVAGIETQPQTGLWMRGEGEGGVNWESAVCNIDS